MRMDTLFQTCIYIVVIMLIFTLSVNFVSALGLFGTLDTGVDVDTTNGSSAFSSVTGGLNANTLWSFFMSPQGAVSVGGLLASLALAIATRNPTILGVGLFSTVFWASYINMQGILNIGSYMPPAFLGIAHAVMLFLWFGAVAGMISGSG
jgi:hypothetical protein